MFTMRDEVFFNLDQNFVRKLFRKILAQFSDVRLDIEVRIEHN